MMDLHKSGWYTAQLTPHLPKTMFQQVPARLLGGLAYLLVILAGLLSIGLFELQHWVNLLTALALGASFAAMAFLGHDILHDTVVRNPWLRDVLGTIAFWPLCTGPHLWRKWHNQTHHVHTQKEGKDPDSWPTLEKAFEIPFLRWAYRRLPHSVRAFSAFATLALTFTVQSLCMFAVYLKGVDPRRRLSAWLHTVLPWATWIGFLFWIGPVKWSFAFLIPLLIANLIIMAYISTNHRLNPLVPVNDPLANSLSVNVPKWVDVLHFNFSHHTEHHLFPRMNSKYYPLVKKHIKRMWPERYHEMALAKALIVLWQTPRLYYYGTELIEPRRGHIYGSLGHGLNPNRIQFHKAVGKEMVGPNKHPHHD